MATEIKIRKLYDFGKQCHTDFLLTSCQKKSKNCRDAEKASIMNSRTLNAQVELWL